MGTFLMKYDINTLITPDFSGAVFQPWRIPGNYDQCGPAFVVPANERWWHFGDRIDGGCQSPPIGTTSTVRLSNFDTGTLYLDGAPTGVGFGSLPKGFLVQGSNGIEGSINFTSGLDYFNDSGAVADDTVIFSVTGDSCWPFTKDGGDGITPTELNGFNRGPNNNSSTPTVYEIIKFNEFICEVTINALALDQHYIRFRYDGTPSEPYASNIFTNLNGDYLIWSNQITIDTDVAVEGDTVTITDGGGALGQFASISAFQIIDGTLFEYPITIVSQTATTIVFTVPAIVVGVPFAVGGLLDGVLFSGTVHLGAFNILLTDGSGLYTLVPGKRNDTYYDRDVESEGTIDLKIPNPRIRTGFLP